MHTNFVNTLYSNSSFSIETLPSVSNTDSTTISMQYNVFYTAIVPFAALLVFSAIRNWKDRTQPARVPSIYEEPDVPLMEIPDIPAEFADGPCSRPLQGTWLDHFEEREGFCMTEGIGEPLSSYL